MILSAEYCQLPPGSGHGPKLKAVQFTQVALILVINPIIVAKVLRFLWLTVGQQNEFARAIWWKIFFLGAAFEIAYFLRILLIVWQDTWKLNGKIWAYNTVFILYLLIGEVGCQLILIAGVS